MKSTKKYDYVIVGAGLSGCIFAYLSKKKGKRCLIVEKRGHIGGNCYTKKIHGIDVHVYGAHIFRTNNKKVWDLLNEVTEFNNFINSPIANYNGEIYNMPFNMNTFSKMWGVATPEEAKQKIEEQRVKKDKPKNLEEHILNLVGRDIYEKLVKGYTEKQWGKECKDLPVDIMKRIPLRFTYDNNYYNSRYQGIPINGYTEMFEKLTDGIEIIYHEDFNKNKEKYFSMADKIVYTGALDELYDYCYGELEYRSLRFENYLLQMKNYQGNAVVNYTDKDTPYTRSIEHKHFNFGEQDETIVTLEYPDKWEKGKEKYYPVNDKKNNNLYKKYLNKAKKDAKLILLGRLAEYKYYDMNDTIESAMRLSKKVNN